MRLRRGESGEGTSAGQSLGHAVKKLETAGSASVRLAEVRRGERGQTTVMMTLFMATFLTGFIALGVDVNSLFAARRQAQAAADAAAIAAAEESTYGTTNETNAAQAAAKLNGFDTGAAINPATVGPPKTPTTGNYQNSGWIEVDVSKPIPSIFARILTGRSTFTVSARAVAAPGQTSPTCVCLEGTTGTDLNLSNNAQFSPNGCGTTVDSDGSVTKAVTVLDSAKLGGTSIGTKAALSTWQGSVPPGDLLATHVVGGLTAGCSPTMPTPPAPSTYAAGKCMGDPANSSTTPHEPWNGYPITIGPGSTYSISQPNNSDGTGVACYTSLEVGANGNVETLNPGIYVINNGELHFDGNGNHGAASGVMFYLVGTASLVIDNGASVNLTAMTTGTYAGIVFLQDSGDNTIVPVRAADTQPITMAGGANTSLNGAFFAPTADVTLNNGTGTTVDAAIVAKTLTMAGGGVLNSTPMAGLGSFNISTAKIAE